MVTILMAVLNGEKYIAQQIESILQQTETEWKLIIQDDCSKDRTAEIVEKYANKFEGKIIFIERKTPSGSAKDNFFSMLQYAGADYTMTCDQDDVWLPDKIEVTLKKMKAIEGKVGSDKPILVHTDLKVVDNNLNVLADSLFAFQKLDSTKDKLNNLLVQNIVTGCTMMVNRALTDKIQSVPNQAIMHDWWFALIASAFGYIGFVDKPTVLYRQHSGNEVGAKDVGSLYYKLKRLFAVEQTKSALDATYKQAEGFMDTYNDQLTEQYLKILAAYVSIPNVNKFKKLKIISKYDFRKSGLFRRCGQILFT